MVDVLRFFRQNVLELEAAVQRDPTNAATWFELGVKQQENERETKAIQALQRAIDLDPTHLSTWLALAVSHTNDSHRLGTYDAIREWALRNPKYEAIVSGTKLATDARGDFVGLIDVLLQMARYADQQEGGVDAEVQVALAVLLNTTEVGLQNKKKKRGHACLRLLTILHLCSSGIRQGGGLFSHSVGRSTGCACVIALVFFFSF